jgi:hypothetical protein
MQLLGKKGEAEGKKCFMIYQIMWEEVCTRNANHTSCTAKFILYHVNLHKIKFESKLLALITMQSLL